MSGVIDTLKYVIQLDSSGVKKGSQEAEAAVGKLSNSFASLASGIKTFIGLAITKQIGDFAFASTLAADRAEVLGKVMERVAHNMGIGADEIKHTQAQLQSVGFTATEALNAMIKFSTSDLGLENLRQLVGISRELSIIMGVDVDEALDIVTNAINTGRTAMLKSYGIVVDAEAAQAKFADTLGVTADRLSEAGQKQALVNGLLEQMATFAGLADDNADSLQVKVHQLSDAFADLKTAIGDALEPFVPVIDAITRGLEYFSLGVKVLANTFDGLKESVKELFSGNLTKADLAIIAADLKSLQLIRDFLNKKDDSGAAGVGKKNATDKSKFVKEQEETLASVRKIRDALQDSNVTYDEQFKAIVRVREALREVQILEAAGLINRKESLSTQLSLLNAHKQELEQKREAGELTDEEKDDYIDIHEQANGLKNEIEEINEALKKTETETASLAERFQEIADIVDSIGYALDRLGVKEGRLIADLNSLATAIATGNIPGIIAGGANVLGALVGGDDAVAASAKVQGTLLELLDSQDRLRSSIDELRSSYENLSTEDAVRREELLRKALELAESIDKRVTGGSDAEKLLAQGQLTDLNRILHELGLGAASITGSHGLVIGQGDAPTIIGQALAAFLAGQREQESFLSPFESGSSNTFENMFQEIYKLRASGDLSADLAKKLLAFWTEFGDLTLEQQEELTNEVFNVLRDLGLLSEADRRDFLLSLKDLGDQLRPEGEDGLTQIQRNITTITEGQANIIAGTLNSILFVLNEINNNLSTWLDRVATAVGPTIQFASGSIVVNQYFGGGTDASFATAYGIKEALRKDVRAYGVQV